MHVYLYFCVYDRSAGRWLDKAVIGDILEYNYMFEPS